MIQENEKADVTKLYQKPKLISSSDEYDKEEDESADDSNDNNQKDLSHSTDKKVAVVWKQEKSQFQNQKKNLHRKKKTNYLFVEYQKSINYSMTINMIRETKYEVVSR
jgi:hypothetical protein